MAVKNFLVGLLLFCSAVCFGQEERSGFSSPYEAIYNHLQYLQEETYDPERAALSLSNAGLTKKQIISLSIELKQILDGTGSRVIMEEVPKNPDYYDSISNRNRYVLFVAFPDIYVEKYDNGWLYSPRTVINIDRIHKEVFPFGTDRLLNLLPKLGAKKYLGLHLWQLIFMLVLIIISYTFHKLLTYTIRNFIVRLLHRYGQVELAKTFILPVAKPFSLFVVISFVRLLVPVLQLPINFGTYIIQAFDAVLPLLATIFFYKLVDALGAYFHKLALKSENTLDDQLVPLVRKALKTFVVLIGILAVLRGLNFDIWPLITGLSIGGLAFALAAQDTLKNFFGSLMIFIDKPFQIGDWVTAGDIDGTVEEVGFRSTRIRTFRDSLLYVPNSIISNGAVDNHGLRKYRRFYTTLSVTYDTPAKKIKVFVKGIEKIVGNHPHTRKDYYNIFLNNYAASSLDIMLYIFFHVPTWTDELRCRQEIMLEINSLAEHLEVRFAFPTQTLHVEEFPGQLSGTPAHSVEEDEMMKKMEAFFIKNNNTGKK